VTRAVFPVMGTMASVLVAESDVAQLGSAMVDRALAASRRDLEILDRRFSHYSLDSEINSWLSGGSVSPDALADFNRVLRACGRLNVESDSVFTIKDPASGRVDTAGYVKGFAMRRAAQTLRGFDVRNFVIGVGGDTFCSGRPGAGRPWRIAVADPLRSRGVAALVDASDLAVATSGTAERGKHIWSGRGPAPTGLSSFTVMGPDIAEADAYATIGFAMGEAGISWVAQRPGYRSLAITSDGALLGDAALVSAA
jgi:thiamine biosynthesis lipoprotein